jgi:hypothetical protein
VLEVFDDELPPPPPPQAESKNDNRVTVKK